MSQLNINTIQNISGGPVELTQQDASKAWAGMVASSGSGISNSLNGSSQTDSGTGDYDYALTNNAAAQMDEYCFAGMAGGSSRFVRVGSADTTASLFDCKLHNHSGTLTDMPHSWSWIGDLA